MSIFINVSSEKPKYLVFYDENENSNDDSTSNQNMSCKSKRAKLSKLDYDAFTNKLRF